MSNLGAYQAFTPAAKAAGGVEQLIKRIEAGAAAKALLTAAPGLLAAGALGATALIFGRRKAYAWVRDFRARQAAIIADGEAAAVELAQLVEASDREDDEQADR